MHPEKAALRKNLQAQEQENAEIRDRLAQERTELANERTLLAYLRTAMGLLVAGVSLIQFFRHQVFIWLGILFVPIGIFTAVLGLRRFLVKRSRLAGHRKAYTSTRNPFPGEPFAGTGHRSPQKP